MKTIKGNITSVKGFTALGKAIGIKKRKMDFAVIYSDKRCNAAAMYTQNAVKGAPLGVTKEHLSDGKAQAIVINSGIANVCTGKRGIEDARSMAKMAAKELGVKEKDVLVASTGIIGHYLPMGKLKKGMKGIKKQLSKKSEVAQAILTTDLVKKEICITDGNFTIGAIAKGSGMIHPNMATMLAFITTDADIPSANLSKMLKEAVNSSFNQMSVDMDTSTSDMCIVLANGHAGKVDEKKFQKALTSVCTELAKKVARDGEGATKLIEVTVKNAKDLLSARKIARMVICSNLFKCAVYGNDPNWGRILCAMGNARIPFEERKVNVTFGFPKGIQIVKEGVTTSFHQEMVRKIMSKDTLHVIIDLKQGKATAKAYGCDMTEGYIRINAHYHT